MRYRALVMWGRSCLALSLLVVKGVVDGILPFNREAMSETFTFGYRVAGAIVLGRGYD
jgi:hypothetical protein